MVKQQNPRYYKISHSNDSHYFTIIDARDVKLLNGLKNDQNKKELGQMQLEDA